MKIFLIGYMGSGKSTLGKQLAQALGYGFIDTDKYIENIKHITIPDIFSTLGEQEFRKIEREVLLTIRDRDNYVISTGGGMPCTEENIEEINSQGLSVYIKLDIKTLANRILNSKKKRPLTEGKSHEELISYIAQALDSRDFFYRQAKLTISGINITHKDIIGIINVY